MRRKQLSIYSNHDLLVKISLCDGKSDFVLIDGSYILLSAYSFILSGLLAFLVPLTGDRERMPLHFFYKDQ